MSAPLVFRLHAPGLRERLERFLEHERQRTGYRLDATQVANRALDEWLATQGYGAVPEKKRKS